MKKQVYIALMFLAGWSSATAQQQFVFTNFLLNDFYYNPAVAGSKDVHVANLVSRNQWSGFEDAPLTVIGNFYGSHKNEMKHGYGISLVNDRTGITQNTFLYLNYAYHVNLNDKLRLGMGVKPGFQQYKIKLYDAQLADQGDDILTGNVFTANALDLTSGLHLYSERFFAVVSMRHMLGKSITFTSYNSSLARHYSFLTGYTINLEKKKIEIQPSILINYVQPVPMQATFGLKTTFDKKFWAGLSFRTDDAVSIAAGFRIKERFSIGYAYDYSISDIRSYQTGSHELVLSFITTPDRPTLDEEDDELNNSIFEENQKGIKERE